MYCFHPKAARDRLGNNVLPYPGHGLGWGRSSQQGWVWQTEIFLVGVAHVLLAVGFKHWRLVVLIHLRTVGMSEVSQGFVEVKVWGSAALVKLLEPVLFSRQFCLYQKIRTSDLNELFASVACYSAALGTSLSCKEEFHGS